MTQSYWTASNRHCLVDSVYWTASTEHGLLSNGKSVAIRWQWTPLNDRKCLQSGDFGESAFPNWRGFEPSKRLVERFFGSSDFEFSIRIFECTRNSVDNGVSTKHTEELQFSENAMCTSQGEPSRLLVTLRENLMNTVHWTLVNSRSTDGTWKKVNTCSSGDSTRIDSSIKILIKTGHLHASHFHWTANSCFHTWKSYQTLIKYNLLLNLTDYSMTILSANFGRSLILMISDHWSVLIMLLKL